MDRIATRRGCFVRDVLRLSPEELSMEIACLQEHERRVATAVKRGAMPVAVCHG